MDVMELVENEPNARPFQCDWQTCSKVRRKDPESGKSMASIGLMIFCRASTENQTFKDIIESIQMNGLTPV